MSNVMLSKDCCSIDKVKRIITTCSQTHRSFSNQRCSSAPFAPSINVFSRSQILMDLSASLTSLCALGTEILVVGRNSVYRDEKQ